jgi:hypothetical protein
MLKLYQMDLETILLGNVPLPTALINIIESYCNAIFVLDEVGLYIFDGKTVEIYKNLETKEGKAKYSNLVYTPDFGLCLKDEYAIKHIDFNDNEIKLITVGSLLNIPLSLIGGDKLYFSVRRVINCIDTTGSKALNPSGEPFYYDNNTFIAWKNYIISVGGTTRINSKMVFSQGKIAPTTIYNTVTNRWITGPGMSCKRSNFAVIVLGDYIYTFGGIIDTPDTLSYNIDRKVEGGSFAFMGISVTHGSKSETNLVERYDLIRNRWSTCQSMPIAAKNITAVIIGKYIYILGCDPSLRYCYTTDKWELVEDFIFNPGCTATGI